MKVIIAEKPSLARTIVKALELEDRFSRQEGFFAGRRYIVTYAFGHLFALKDIAEYTGEEKWRLDMLPFVPEHFEFRLKQAKKDTARTASIKAQYEIIKSLIARPDVEAVVNCGDSDREGQVIGDLIISTAFAELGEEKPVYRLWLPEQTEETIREAVASMKENGCYRALFDEGVARTYMDWLLGINLTRYLSIKLNHLMPCGRVLIPIVKIIYDRDMAIKNFKPERYFQLESAEETNGEQVKLTYKPHFAASEEAAACAAQLNSEVATVSQLEQKEVTKQPSKLFSLSTLQSRLSKQHKMTLADSLAIIQGLYEKGYVTYPRTNSEYLAAAEQEKVAAIVAGLNGEEPFLTVKDTKRIFDDTKIESHSALIITNKVPPEGELSADEQVVYDTIKNRFIANFLTEATTADRTVMDITIGEEVFTLKGEVIKNPGFYKYEPVQEKENRLPKLAEGERVNINFRVVEKETKPPKKFDIAMLASYLKNPFREELKDKNGDDDAAEYKAMLEGVEIGTEATRTGIIENAKKAAYISEKNTILSIEPLGVQLINSLDKLHINLYKEKTVEFSRLLKKVYRGQSSVDDCIAFTAAELKKIVSDGADVQLEKIAAGGREPVGKCPRCGRDVYEGTKSYYCAGYREEPKCEFAIWKKDKFWEARGKKLTTAMVKKFLLGKSVTVKGLKKKSGDGTYTASISMVDTGKYINYKMSFD